MKSLLAGSLALAVTSIASADVYTWDSFMFADGGPNYATSSDASMSSATLYNFGSGAIVSGSGNLYGMGGALNIHTYVNTFMDVESLSVEMKGIGSAFNTYDALLAYTTTDGQSYYFDTFGPSASYTSEVAGEGFGAYEIMNWSFDLSSVEGTISSLGFLIQSYGPHASLDYMTMDITMVPAPGALAILGLAGIASRRRRN